MNKYTESVLVDLEEIAGNGLNYSDALALLLAGELRRLNDSMDYLKRAAGNIDDTIARMEHPQ